MVMALRLNGPPARIALEKRPTELRRHHRYRRDGRLASGLFSIMNPAVVYG